jgi:hypothetical protein
MKYSLLAIAGAAANDKFLGLDDDMTNLIHIGSGACVNWNSAAGKFWDFSNLDKWSNGNENSKAPTKVSRDLDTHFWFSLCQAPW